MSEPQPTETERVAALLAEAAEDLSTYHATREPSPGWACEHGDGQAGTQ